MLTKERQQQILSYLSQHNTVTVQELSARLYASSSTIRRDLSELEEQGILKRVHGGAVLTAQYARSIGADYYTKDAKASADAAKEVFGG